MAGMDHPTVPSGCPWLLLGPGAGILAIMRKACGAAGTILMKIIILGARSFVWPFLILGAHPGFSFCCWRWNQWDFHWVALGFTRAAGLCFPLAWEKGLSLPLAVTQSPGWFRGPGVASPAIAPFVLHLIKFSVGSGSVKQFGDVIPLICQQAPPGLC